MLLGVSFAHVFRGGWSHERERAARNAADEGTEGGRLARTVLAGGPGRDRPRGGGPSPHFRCAYDWGDRPARHGVERRRAPPDRGRVASGFGRRGLASGRDPG